MEPVCLDMVHTAKASVHLVHKVNKYMNRLGSLIILTGPLTLCYGLPRPFGILTRVSQAEHSDRAVEIVPRPLNGGQILGHP